MKAEQEPSTTTTMEPIIESYASYFSPREFEVADILVGLPDIIISKLDHRPRIRVPWGHKKKRSALSVQDQKVKKKSSSSTVVRLRLPSSSSSPNPAPKIPAVNVVKVERSSPNTPLSFESEEKPSQLMRSSRVVSVKRKREEWLEVIDGLSTRKDLLQKEIENVKDYKEKLIKFNLVLQSRKQELKRQRLIQEEAQLKIEEQNLNLDMQLGRPTLVPSSIVICAPTVVKQEHYHQQIAPHQYQMQIMDHTAQSRSAVISENHGFRASNTQVASTSLPSNSLKATGVRLVSCNNNGGSIIVPDCSFSFPNQNNSSSLATNNLYKAMSAQRRHERYQKNRVKKTSLLGQRQSQEL